MNRIKSLVKKAQTGDLNAFNTLLDEYKDFAYSIAFRICRNEHDAEDVVQDAFITVFKSIKQFRNESAFSTWLYRIVYNESVRLLKMNTHVDVTCLDNGESVDFAMLDNTLQTLVDEERSQLITTALDQLHYNEHVVLTMHYLHNKSIRDIHQITGLSPSNIKVLLHRARKKLHTILTRSVPEIRGSA